MPVIPKSRPQKSKSEVEAILEPLLGTLPEKKFPLVAFGLRGYYADTFGVKGKNDRGQWDDAIGWLDRRTGGFQIWNGNTDPTAKFKEGLGQIHAPQILYFRIGKHKGRPAFRQAATFLVDRDGANGPVKASIDCAFNWHDSLNPIKTTSSEGCQTMPKDQFKAAREYGYVVVRQYYPKTETFPYLLVDLTQVQNVIGVPAMTAATKPSEAWTIGKAGVDLIKSFEDLYLDAYQDPVGIWTIGYGTIAGVKPGMRITKEQAEQLLTDEIEEKCSAICQLVRVPTTQNQRDALISFSYNCGAAALKGSTLLKLLNQKNYKAAADQFLVWNKAKGKVLKGLTRRREAERALFLKP